MAVGSGRRLPPDASPERVAAAIEKGAAKVVSGAFLPHVPEPDFPLAEIARKRYFELATDMLQQGILTKVSRMQAEAVAASYGEIHKLLSLGERVSAALQRQYETGLHRLYLAERSQKVSSNNAPNKFSDCGFAYSRSSPVTVRRAPSA